jgi:hypothetical protein
MFWVFLIGLFIAGRFVAALERSERLRAERFAARARPYRSECDFRRRLER